VSRGGECCGEGVATAYAYDTFIRVLGILRGSVSNDSPCSFGFLMQKLLAIRCAYALNLTCFLVLRSSIVEVYTLTYCCARKSVHDTPSMNLVLSQISRSFRILLHAYWFCLLKIAQMVSYFIVYYME
jgi:hypothetical protein